MGPPADSKDGRSRNAPPARADGTGRPRWSRRRVAAAARSTATSALLLAALVAGILAFGVGCDSGDGTTAPGSDLQGGGEPVSFATTDGVTLAGALFGDGDRGVVLLHMYPADQTSWFVTAVRLAEDGYLVLTIDFRGYGGSGGDKDIGLIYLDAEAAVAEIGRRGARSVVLVGASMGGTAALMAADVLAASGVAAASGEAEPGSQVASVPVVGVATLSAPVEFEGLDATGAAGRVTVPKLFLGTEGDSGGEAARELYDLAAEPRDVEIYPGGDHGTDMLTGAAGQAVNERLDEWLAGVLGPAAPGGGS